MKKYLSIFILPILVLSACGGESSVAPTSVTPPPAPVPPPPPPPPVADADKDTVPDAQDNCPAKANTDQADDDYDGAGNVCDAAYGVDADGDGILDSTVAKITGDIISGGTLTINGSGFSEKAEASPYFWWKADFGEFPSALGRRKVWDDTTGINHFSTDIVAPGSGQAAFNDHGSNSGIALSRVNFDSDQLYIYRKTYEDFDITKDEAIKARVILNSGTLKVGDVITGAQSGASGTLVKVAEAHPNITYMTHEIHFSNASGSLAQDPPLDFIKGEKMTSNSGADITDVQVFRTFNFKTMRFSSKGTGQPNNMWIGAQGNEGSKFRITPEYTDGTTWPADFTRQVLNQLPYVWKTEEVQYQTSGIDVRDGIFNFYQNGVLGTDSKFRNRKADTPEPYNSLVMSQVSHLAQLGSRMYYDSLYIDDSWHRVVICSSASFDSCDDREVQIPATWVDNAVKVELNLGGLDTAKPLYLYVVNKDGLVNSEGWKLN